MNKERNILRYKLEIKNKIGIQFKGNFAIVIYLPLKCTCLIISL